MIEHLFERPRRRWYDALFLRVVLIGGPLGGPAAVYLAQNWPN